MSAQDINGARTDERGNYHAEAFCLMTYECYLCRGREVFWNSRDGVTPFSLTRRCLKCGGDMRHTEFQADRYVPDHIPQRGQGVFIDMPESFKRPVALMRVKASVEAGYPTPDGMVDDIIASFHPGEPWFIRW